MPDINIILDNLYQLSDAEARRIMHAATSAMPETIGRSKRSPTTSVNTEDQNHDRSPMSRSSPSNCSAWQDCLQHAFEEAAVGIENWEYAGYESEEEKQMTFKAAKEVAKLIRAMAWRRYLAHHRKQNALHELPPPCGSECTQDTHGG